MEGQRRERVVAGVALALVGLLGLAMAGLVAAVIAFWSAAESPNQALDERYERLIDELRHGSFVRLEDISPAPAYIRWPEQYADPPPKFRCCLVYDLGDERGTLNIALDQQLRLMDYHIEKD